MTDRRCHSVLALLVVAATALGGSLLFASSKTEETESIHRQLLQAKRAKLSSLADPKSVVPRINAATVADAAGGPNIIYIQHESLSGSIALNTAAGAKAMPFFQNMMHNDRNFYVFEHARTVSGNTMDAVPALMTGCMPYTADGLKWVHKLGRSVGYDFHRLGYRTASFSSRMLDKTIKTGQWSILYDMLVGGMDKVVDPLSQKFPRDNKEGTDDRRMLPVFEEWLLGLAEEDASRPFYAQMYNFNQHYPYMKKEGVSTERYYQSLATTDEFFQGLMEILSKTGHLQNTIIVGSGDHGEEPFKKGLYTRLLALNSNILQPASYIYYPQKLMPDSSIAVRLRSNTQKLMHTTDLYQTLQGIISRTFGTKALDSAPRGCITGMDLAEVDVPEDRVVISWNLFSSKAVSKMYRGQYWVLSTKEVSLYHRKHAKKNPTLHQGKNNTYVLKHGDCTRNTSPKNLCQASLNEEYKGYFRGVISWIKKTSLYDEDVKTSQLVEFFSNRVSWKETA